MVAQRVLSEEEYDKWNKQYHDASVALQNRDKKLDKAAADVEVDLDVRRFF